MAAEFLAQQLGDIGVDLGERGGHHGRGGAGFGCSGHGAPVYLSDAFGQPSRRACAGPCHTGTMPRLSEPSPYVEFDRKQWRALRMSTPLALTEEELIGLRGLGEQIDLTRSTRCIYRWPESTFRSPPATIVRRDPGILGETHQHPDRRCRSSSASRAAWQSANRRPPACCRRCWPGGTITPGWTWSPPTASCTPTPNWSGETSCTARDSRGELRPPQAAALRHRGEIGGGGGLRADLFTPGLRLSCRNQFHLRAPARHPDHGGPERAADRAAADGLGSVRFLRVCRRADRGYREMVCESLFSFLAQDGVRQSEFTLPPLRRFQRPQGCHERGTGNLVRPPTGPIWSRTFCRPRPAQPWCYARIPTTPSIGFACASYSTRQKAGAGTPATNILRRRPAPAGREAHRGQASHSEVLQCPANPAV